MMDTIRKFKMPIIIVAVLIVVFILYSIFFKKGADENGAVLTTTETSGPSTSVGQQFLDQLLTLENLDLNDGVFSDPRFQSLEDFSQPIPDEPQGRPNPFAPIGVDVAGRPTTGSSTGNSFNFTFGTASSTNSTNSAR